MSDDPHADAERALHELRTALGLLDTRMPDGTQVTLEADLETSLRRIETALALHEQAWQSQQEKIIKRAIERSQREMEAVVLAGTPNIVPTRFRVPRETGMIRHARG